MGKYLFFEKISRLSLIDYNNRFQYLVSFFVLHNQNQFTVFSRYEYGLQECRRSELQKASYFMFIIIELLYYTRS